MEFSGLKLLLIIILGSILLYSYYYIIDINKNKINVNDLWGKIDYPLRYFYYVSMILSAIGFLIVLYYLYLTNDLTELNSNMIFYLLALIIILSMFWMPLSVDYLKKNNYLLGASIVILLLIIGILSFGTLYQLFLIKEKKFKITHILSLIGMGYFTFHTLVLDAIVWSYYFI